MTSEGKWHFRTNLGVCCLVLCPGVTILSFLGFCLSPVLQLMGSRLMQVTGDYLRTTLRMMNWEVLSVLCCCVMVESECSSS